MGLFGLSPEDVQTLQQQQDTQQATAAAQNPGTPGIYGATIAGNMIGRGIAGALGYENPQMAKAKKLQQAMQETNASGIDFQKDPLGYMSLGVRNLMKYGLQEQAMAMADKLKEAQHGMAAQAQARKVQYDIDQDAMAQQENQDISGKYQDLNAQADALMANPRTREQGIKLHDSLKVKGQGRPLAQEQEARDSLRAAFKAAKAANQPQEVIDGIQEKLDETDANIKKLSGGDSRNIQFKDLATGNTVNGKPEFQDYRVMPDGTLKPEGSPYVKGASTEVNLKIGTEPLPEKAQDKLTQAFQMKSALDDVKSVIGKSGVIQGWISKGAAALGTDKDAIKFETAVNNLKVMAQAIIVGIPSNFDVQTFIETLPSLTRAESVNEQRIVYTENAIKGVVRDTLAYYKGTKKITPPHIVQMAKDIGIDPDNVKGWDGKGDPLKTAIGISGQKAKQNAAPLGEEDPNNRPIVRPMNKNQQAMPAPLAPPGLEGWHIETDAQGKKAWVSPDRKKFREIE